MTEKDQPPVSPADPPFERRDMVNWFAPGELARAGVKAVLSQVFGAYADNREIQALRDDGLVDPTSGATLPAAHYSEQRGGIWFDYVADLGDGFDPTYAVAQMLAATELSVEGAKTPLPRGRFLVMGGDQVYPTATRDEYENRLYGPYRAALPWVDPEKGPPDLFAIPGNHDWYDGLTSFTRLFCQDRWIGGWKTKQRRSYFALKLPHNWWVWGLDIQLGADIDHHQLEYFRNLKGLQDGDKIILCVAEPLWLKASRGNPESYDNLRYFEKKVLAGKKFVVGLAGDLHAYARYQSDDGRQRFVSGGGGAYLYPTHELPEELAVPTKLPDANGDRAPEGFVLGRGSNGQPALYPPPGKSRKLARGVLRFGLSQFSFALLFGALYVILAWLLQSAGESLVGPGGVAVGFLDSAADGLIPMFGRALAVFFHAPLAVIVVALLWAGLVAFAGGRRLIGTIHTLLHVLAVLLLSWLLMQCSWAQEFLAADDVSWGNVGYAFVFAIAMLVSGSVFAGLIWGVYLFLSHSLLRDTHSNDVLACQSLTGFKHVLRLHVEQERVTVYPLGLKTVPKRWEYRPGVTGGEAWFETTPPVVMGVELIEPAVVVATSRVPESS